jgi:hypothetical protein
LCLLKIKNVGATLLAKAVSRSIKMLTVPASSRAGSLPHGFCGYLNFVFVKIKNVGASLLAKAVSQSLGI